MLIFNYIFYILLFVGFFLPTNSTFYLPVGPLLLSLRELSLLLLPVVNLLSRPMGDSLRAHGKIRIFILLFLIFAISSEFVLKTLAYNQTFIDGFKSFRVGVPLFSSLLLFYQGLRPNPRKVWNVLLSAIGISVLLSLLSIVMPLPIYYNLEAGESALDSAHGRVLNSNAPFGIIGLYLLFRNKNAWYNKGKWKRAVMWLSIIALVLTFNRTYLSILVLGFVILAWKDFSQGRLVRVIGLSMVLATTCVVMYSSIPIIKRQVDVRILSILYQESSLYKATIQNNRDMIYEGIFSRIKEGYWVFGLPYEKEIFSKSLASGGKKMSMTDTSMVNILLRYGFVSLIFFVSLMLTLYKRHTGVGLVLLLYLLASLNIDSLVSHNSIFFFIIFFIINGLRIVPPLPDSSSIGEEPALK